MLLFNGLYFRGSWAQPFMELRSDEIKYFNALSGKQDVKFMSTVGNFKYAEIPSKKLIAVELPYKVRAIERVHSFVFYSDFWFIIEWKIFAVGRSPWHWKRFETLFKRIKLQHFKWNCVAIGTRRCSPSYAQIPIWVYESRWKSFRKSKKNLLHVRSGINESLQLGLTTLFTSKADLRGITKDAKNYQIEELVQHVAIRVDEGSSSQSALSGKVCFEQLFVINFKLLNFQLEMLKAVKMEEPKRFPLISHSCSTSEMSLMMSS